MHTYIFNFELNYNFLNFGLKSIYLKFVLNQLTNAWLSLRKYRKKTKT